MRAPKRGTRLSVRVTPGEAAIIRAAAKRIGLNVAEFLRHEALVAARREREAIENSR